MPRRSRRRSSSNHVRGNWMTIEIQAMAIVKHIGIGSAEALRGADLRLPAGAGA